MSLVSVVVDSREPDWIQALNFNGAAKIIAALDAGDILAACDDGALLGIERKTATDFLNTLRDDRLFPQLSKLREQSPWSYLVICGNLTPGPAGKCFADGKETGWNWSSISGALLTVQEIGIHIVQIAGDHEYEQAILRLAGRERKSLSVKPARDLTLVSDAEQILAALPGVGPERIKAVIDYTGSVGWALTWLTDDRDCNSVPGIGLKTKQRIRAALGIEPGDYLAVIEKATEQPKEKVA